jgi:hypothetical protein
VDASYGRAAKVIAIYLKSSIVLGPAWDSSLARVAHPPIDRELLKKLASSEEFKSECKKHWAKTNWTQLDKTKYKALINQLRDIPWIKDKPLWMLEKYWNLSES